MTLVVRNKIQGLDVQSFSGASDIRRTEHCKEYVNGMERKQDCFCLQFSSGNRLYYAHKIYEYRLER
jgi:hypothetical protein